ncbi:MAG: enoyl-CoA hydratase/isomerase family protein [Alphaproteobacteria bacterium]|nr:enoyl-CoA hydratase/isomerase family protein [Alphaproteobacteria bacterium]
MAEVLLERRGALGLITLNRPQALNALTLEMIHAMTDRLADWAADPAVAGVLIRGAGDKAFSAGGDIRALIRPDNADYIAGFFADEYRLNRLIFRYPKPYVALIDGIAMGGGVGVSVNGAFRIATGATLFAMPETGIGMYPDVGGSYFLPRCPGETGMYLGLTGARLDVADCLYTGIADVQIGAESHGAMIERLAAGDAAETVLRALAEPPGPAPLAEHREAIDRCFAGDSVEDIVAALEGEGGDFAARTLEALAAKSPFALKVAFRQLRQGRALDFEECMAMEYRLSQRVVPGHDFREGVRAAVIDKDRSPRWHPATLAAVSDDRVAACFAPLPGGELTFAAAPGGGITPTQPSPIKGEG